MALGGQGGDATASAGTSSAGSSAMSNAGATVFNNGGSEDSGGAGGSAEVPQAGSGGTADECAAADECCDDPNKTEPGVCGCGTADTDSDNDGTPNCEDDCSLDPNKTEAGECGCGMLDNDSDDDGGIDCIQGHFYEAEDATLSDVDVPVTSTLDGGAADAGVADGGLADGGTPSYGFTVAQDATDSSIVYIESPAGVASTSAAGPARATFDIDIPLDDEYIIWARLYTPDATHNRLWYKVDDGDWAMLRATTGETWFWYHFHLDGEFDTPIQFMLTAGAHQLSIASASDGVRIDRVYISGAGDEPAGNDTTCNPPHTIQVGDDCVSSCGQLGGNSCSVADCAGHELLAAYDCDTCCTLP